MNYSKYGYFYAGAVDYPIIINSRNNV